MLYKNLESYTPGLKMHKEGFILLDMASLQSSSFKELYNKIGEESKIDQQIVEIRFANTLLSPEDLSLKIKAVVLPFDCFIRPFKPIDQQGESLSQCTPYQYLKKKYESYLTIGLKINFQKPQQIEKLRQLGIIKKMKLFSFDISEVQMIQHLPFLRQYVNDLFKIDKKIHFHIKLHLQSVKGLKMMKQEFILHQYPLQFCILQTNLINLIEMRFNLTFQQNWEEIAFKYTKAIAKYVPVAIGCLLQSHISQTLGKNIDRKRYFECLNHINLRNERQQKIYKSFHNTGLGTISPLMLQLLSDFTPDEYGHFRARGDWNIYLSKMYDVVIGKYKHEQSIKLFQFVPEELK